MLKLLSAEGIYQGVTVDGISLEGMSQEEALATLEEKYVTEVNGQVLTFQFDEETTWEMTFTDLGAGYHLEEAVEQAYNTGREGTNKERFQVGAQLLQDGIDIPLEYSYDTEKMKAKLTEIAGEFDRHAVDSTVSRITTSCCPSYIELVEKHIPGMKPYVSSTGSPMYYAARIAKDEAPRELQP